MRKVFRKIIAKIGKNRSNLSFDILLKTKKFEIILLLKLAF